MGDVLSSPFDRIAAEYDTTWSMTSIGTHQRLAVWKHIDRLFKPGELVLDIGCGSGLDAVHLATNGITVHGIDASINMVDTARTRGVHAHHHKIEDLHRLLPMRFDGAISNFGALNCVSSLEAVAASLAALVRPGGHVALCLIGTFCAWETGYFLAHGRIRKAFRRLRGTAASSLGVNVHYFSHRAVLTAFRYRFRLKGRYGIGVCVPPSYVGVPDEGTVARWAALDTLIAHRPVFRSIADHRLYVFQRYEYC